MKSDLPYLGHISDSIAAIESYVAGGRESFSPHRTKSRIPKPTVLRPAQSARSATKNIPIPVANSEKRGMATPANKYFDREYWCRDPIGNTPKASEPARRVPLCRSWSRIPSPTAKPIFVRHRKPGRQKGPILSHGTSALPDR